MKLRRAWKFFSWCLRQLGNSGVAILWILLLAALAGQIHLLSSKRVPVPEPLRRLVEKRLAGQGVHFTYARSSMDLSGHLLLEDVTLADADTPGARLAGARFVYLDLDPWDLVIGQLDIREVRVNGLNLYAPPGVLAPDESKATAHGISLSFHPEGRQVKLSYLSGYIGGIPVHAAGRVALVPQPKSEPGDAADRVALAWSQIARLIHEAEPKLAALKSPRLDLRLHPAFIDISIDAASVDLGAMGLDGLAGELAGLHAETRLSLSAPLRAPALVTGSISKAILPGEISAESVAFQLSAQNSPTLNTLGVQTAALRWRKIDAGPLVLTARQTPAETIAAELSLALAGGSWTVHGDVDPKEQAGSLALSGFVDNHTLAFVGGLIGKDLAALLDPVESAPLHVRARFLPGWKLGPVTGRLHSGSVRVGDAILDETGAEFTYDDNRVRADNLVLRQGASLAHGSYEMDTQTNDFRFLLTGRLQPMGIAGWFHAWWTNFWTMFDFSRGLADADVDVQGRWGDRYGTRVFVQAEGAHTGIKGVAFDRVRTRLFLRPNWFDILHFEVDLNDQSARGRLARSIDLEQDTWRHMDFSVRSTLPLETISTLFKEESAELLAPYSFTRPPLLELSGRVDSAASPDGKKENLLINLSSTGPLTYHGFPLSDLKFNASMSGDVIELPKLAVTFAKGLAEGNARISGAPDHRRLAFDITLTKANLGEVVAAVNRLPAADGTASPKAATLDPVLAERLERGRLNFALKAEGEFANFHSFHGAGHATIAGAELAQLNLFGPLSEALRGTMFNFGSVSLTTVEAPFQLNGDRVHFDELRVTGPSALLDARGDYHLRDSRLDFTAKLYPFDESRSLMGNAMGFVLTPLSKILEVKLAGTLSKPSWIFSYGPSRLLNRLGNEKTDAPPAPSPVSSAP